MKHIVCTIKDRAVNAFNRPIFVPSVGLAIRSFTDEANKEGQDIYNHPEDYDLYELGSWDDETAIYTPLEMPRVLTRAQDIVIKK